jgi:hypothetical protein
VVLIRPPCHRSRIDVGGLDHVDGVVGCLRLVRTVAVVVAVLAVVAATPARAQRASTDGGLARAREALLEAQRDGAVPTDVVVLLVSARPAYAETRAAFPAAAAAVLVDVFGPGRVRACEACMNPRVVEGSAGVRYDTGEITLADALALDAATRGAAPAARLGAWLEETPTGVALRIVDLGDGSVLLSRHLDPALQTLQRSARQVTVTEDIRRRLRGDSLTHVHWNLGLYPGQHLSLELLDQFGPARTDLAGLSLTMVNPLLGVGGAYQRIFPEAWNVAVGGKVIVGIPGLVIDAFDQNLPPDPQIIGLIGGPVTVMATAQLPIFDTNYAVFAFAGLHLPSFLPSAGLGISLLNVHVLPILP